MNEKHISQAPTIFVIFGATGDLMQRKLISALLDLFMHGYLPDRFRVLGFSRNELSDIEFQKMMSVAIENKKHSHDQKIIDKFLSHLCYESGLFEKAEDYERISEQLIKLDDEFGQCTNKLFYLAVPPQFYDNIFQNLADSGLTIPCSEETGWTRILVEKPFGRDIESAQALDHKMSLLFKEEQIFRIDHYLAKETLQNILTFRFSNALFEPLWDNRYIEKVEIQLFEAIGVEGRGSFYDSIGALRDVGQNHLLQMLAFIAMDDPVTLEANVIREKRAEVLRQLSTTDISDCVRGQFKGYLDEKGVAEKSKTETYFRIKASLNIPKWRNVPFLIESGKHMKETKTEIKIYFKSSVSCLCPPEESHNHQNVLTFRVQPDEGISINFWAKKPGFDFALDEKRLSFSYRDSPDMKALPDAYERVLFDCVRGDQTLFASTDEVDASWNFITPILRGWENTPLIEYDKGSDGTEI